ncbi:hypothetical protein IAU59_000865 [Kwoniella sp. CBS 9459]
MSASAPETPEDRMQVPNHVATPLKDHPQYLVGDLLVISSDNVVFTVYKGLLGQRSNVFRDMASLPSPEPMALAHSLEQVDAEVKARNKQFIHLSESSFVLENFFALLYGPKLIQLDTSFDVTKDLFALCDSYDCDDEIVKKVRDRLYKMALDGRQWDLLIWASDRNDRAIGAATLGMMDQKIFAAGVGPGVYYYDTFWSSMNKLSSAWRSKIFELCFDNPHNATVVRLQPITRKTKKEHLLRDSKSPHRRGCNSDYEELVRDEGAIRGERLVNGTALSPSDWISLQRRQVSRRPMTSDKMDTMQALQFLATQQTRNLQFIMEATKAKADLGTLKGKRRSLLQGPKAPGATVVIIATQAKIAKIDDEIDKIQNSITTPSFGQPTKRTLRAPPTDMAVDTPTINKPSTPNANHLYGLDTFSLWLPARITVGRS